MELCNGWHGGGLRAGRVTFWERFCTRQRSDSLPNWWRWLMKARHLSPAVPPSSRSRSTALFWAGAAYTTPLLQRPRRKLFACTTTDNVWWEVSGTGSHVMQQSCGILNSESMRVERCGCTGIVHWTGAPPVTALPSTAALAHCVTFKMILNTHTYSQQEFSSYPSCMFYRAFTTDVISINEYVILSRGHFHNRQMLCGKKSHLKSRT